MHNKHDKTETQENKNDLILLKEELENNKFFKDIQTTEEFEDFCNKEKIKEFKKNIIDDIIKEEDREFEKNIPDIPYYKSKLSKILLNQKLKESEYVKNNPNNQLLFLYFTKEEVDLLINSIIFQKIQNNQNKELIIENINKFDFLKKEIIQEAKQQLQKKQEDKNYKTRINKINSIIKQLTEEQEIINKQYNKFDEDFENQIKILAEEQFKYLNVKEEQFTSKQLYEEYKRKKINEIKNKLKNADKKQEYFLFFLQKHKNLHKIFAITKNDEYIFKYVFEDIKKKITEDIIFSQNDFFSINEEGEDIPADLKIDIITRAKNKLEIEFMNNENKEEIFKCANELIKEQKDDNYYTKQMKENTFTIEFDATKRGEDKFPLDEKTRTRGKVNYYEKEHKILINFRASDESSVGYPFVLKPDKQPVNYPSHLIRLINPQKKIKDGRKRVMNAIKSINENILQDIISKNKIVLKFVGERNDELSQFTNYKIHGDNELTDYKTCAFFEISNEILNYVYENAKDKKIISIENIACNSQNHVVNANYLTEENEKSTFDLLLPEKEKRDRFYVYLGGTRRGSPDQIDIATFIDTDENGNTKKHTFEDVDKPINKELFNNIQYEQIKSNSPEIINFKDQIDKGWIQTTQVMEILKKNNRNIKNTKTELFDIINQKKVLYKEYIQKYGDIISDEEIKKIIIISRNKEEAEKRLEKRTLTIRNKLDDLVRTYIEEVRADWIDLQTIKKIAKKYNYDTLGEIKIEEIIKQNKQKFVECITKYKEAISYYKISIVAIKQAIKKISCEESNDKQQDKQNESLYSKIDSIIEKNKNILKQMEQKYKDEYENGNIDTYTIKEIIMMNNNNEDGDDKKIEKELMLEFIKDSLKGDLRKIIENVDEIVEKNVDEIVENSADIDEAKKKCRKKILEEYYKDNVVNKQNIDQAIDSGKSVKEVIEENNKAELKDQNYIQLLNNYSNYHEIIKPSEIKKILILSNNNIKIAKQNIDKEILLHSVKSTIIDESTGLTAIDLFSEETLKIEIDTILKQSQSEDSYNTDDVINKFLNKNKEEIELRIENYKTLKNDFKYDISKKDIKECIRNTKGSLKQARIEIIHYVVKYYNQDYKLVDNKDYKLLEKITYLLDHEANNAQNIEEILEQAKKEEEEKIEKDMEMLYQEYKEEYEREIIDKILKKYNFNSQLAKEEITKTMKEYKQILATYDYEINVLGILNKKKVALVFFEEDLDSEKTKRRILKNIKDIKHTFNKYNQRYGTKLKYVNEDKITEIENEILSQAILACNDPDFDIDEENDIYKTHEDEIERTINRCRMEKQFKEQIDKHLFNKSMVNDDDLKDWETTKRKVVKLIKKQKDNVTKLSKKYEKEINKGFINKETINKYCNKFNDMERIEYKIINNIIQRECEELRQNKEYRRALPEEVDIDSQASLENEREKLYKMLFNSLFNKNNNRVYSDIISNIVNNEIKKDDINVEEMNKNIQKEISIRNIIKEYALPIEAGLINEQEIKQFVNTTAEFDQQTHLNNMELTKNINSCIIAKVFKKQLEQKRIDIKAIKSEDLLFQSKKEVDDILLNIISHIVSNKYERSTNQQTRNNMFYKEIVYNEIEQYYNGIDRRLPLKKATIKIINDVDKIIENSDKKTEQIIKRNDILLNEIKKDQTTIQYVDENYIKNIIEDDFTLEEDKIKEQVNEVVERHKRRINEYKEEFEKYINDGFITDNDIESYVRKLDFDESRLIEYILTKKFKKINNNIDDKIIKKIIHHEVSKEEDKCDGGLIIDNIEKAVDEKIQCFNDLTDKFKDNIKDESITKEELARILIEHNGNLTEIEEKINKKIQSNITSREKNKEIKEKTQELLQRNNDIKTAIDDKYISLHYIERCVGYNRTEEQINNIIKHRKEIIENIKQKCNNIKTITEEKIKKIILELNYLNVTQEDVEENLLQNEFQEYIDQEYIDDETISTEYYRLNNQSKNNLEDIMNQIREKIIKTTNIDKVIEGKISPQQFEKITKNIKWELYSINDVQQKIDCIVKNNEMKIKNLTNKFKKAIDNEFITKDKLLSIINDNIIKNTSKIEEEIEKYIIKKHKDLLNIDLIITKDKWIYTRYNNKIYKKDKNGDFVKASEEEMSAEEYENLLLNKKIADESIFKEDDNIRIKTDGQGFFIDYKGKRYRRNKGNEYKFEKKLDIKNINAKTKTEKVKEQMKK